MDLTKFTDADLQALSTGDLTKMSDVGLQELHRQRVGVLGKEGVQRSSPPMFTPSGEKDLPAHMFDFAGKPDMIAAFPPVRFALGAAAPFIGLGQLQDEMTGGHLGATEKAEQLNSIVQSGRQKIGSEGFDWTKFAGEVPMWGRVPAGKTLGTRMALGSAVGAAAGATQPVDNGKDFWDQKAGQVVGGAALGPLLPLAAAGARKGSSILYHGLIEPWARPEAIKGRAYLEAAGDKADAIIDLLRRNKEIVPGSKPTAGEAASEAGRAEFSALQASATKARPSEYLERADSQNAARVAAIESFAGTPAKRAEAVAAREERAGPHYDAGMMQTADTAGLKTLMERPSSRAALSRATRLMEERDKPVAELFPNNLPRAMTGEEAQSIKMAFDDLIKATPTRGIDTAELDAIKATRAEFVQWMEKAFPELGTGRKLYKMTSAPVNQMDVGAELRNTLTTGLRGEEVLRPEVFAKNTRDAAGVIKRATGEKRYDDLSQVLSNRQLASVEGVNQDLARSARSADMARKGAGAGPNALDLATGNLEREAGGKVPNLLNRGLLLANAIITRLEGRVNKKLASEMAAEMLNPPGVAESLAVAQARATRNKVLAEQISKLQAPIIAGGQAAAAQ